MADLYLILLSVSFAKEPHKRDYVLQTRPMILRSLLNGRSLSNSIRPISMSIGIDIEIETGIDIEIGPCGAYIYVYTYVYGAYIYGP